MQDLEASIAQVILSPALSSILLTIRCPPLDPFLKISERILLRLESTHHIYLPLILFRPILLTRNHLHRRVMNAVAGVVTRFEDEHIFFRWYNQDKNAQLLAEAGEILDATYEKLGVSFLYYSSSSLQDYLLIVRARLGGGADQSEDHRCKRARLCYCSY